MDVSCLTTESEGVSEVYVKVQALVYVHPVLPYLNPGPDGAA